MSSRITPERLLDCCMAPRTTAMLSIPNRWLETIPVDNAFQILDLYEIEQRLGCWGGIFPYAESRDPGFIIFPMCHREIIERMITLPADYRLSGTLMKDVINAEWPELLAWPFNKPVGVSKILLGARRTQQRLVQQANRVDGAVRNHRRGSKLISVRLPQIGLSSQTEE